MVSREEQWDDMENQPMPALTTKPGSTQVISWRALLGALISIVGIPFSLFILTPYMGPVAALLGFYAYHNDIKKAGQQGRRLALVAIILGLLETITSACAIIYYINHPEYW